MRKMNEGNLAGGFSRCGNGTPRRENSVQIAQRHSSTPYTLSSTPGHTLQDGPFHEGNLKCLGLDGLSAITAQAFIVSAFMEICDLLERSIDIDSALPG